MEEKTFSGTSVATIRFLKGVHAAQIQTWRKDKERPIGDRGRQAGGRQALTRDDRARRRPR
jgi:hypothetical protein